MNAKEVLETAESVVRGDRMTDYGHPYDNHNCTAMMWGEYLKRAGLMHDDRVMTANDVCMLNILQKVSREANKHKDDTYVDIIGYTLNAAMCKDELEAVVEGGCA